MAERERAGDVDVDLRASPDPSGADRTELKVASAFTLTKPGWPPAELKASVALSAG
jgi:hypothetical protein